MTKKYILIAIASFTFVACGFQSDNDNNATKEETSRILAFIDQDGLLTKREYHSIFEAEESIRSDFELTTIIVTEIHTGLKLGGLQVINRTRGTGYYSSSSVSVGYIDFDELDGCISALKYFRDSVMTSNANLSDAWDYRTRGKVKLTFGRYLYSGDITTWELKITPEEYKDSSYSMTAKEGGLDEIISKFQEAHDHLSTNL